MTRPAALLSILAFLALFTGCSGGTGDSGAAPAATSGNPLTWRIFQNPFMAPNPNNNMHLDSYLTDAYLTPGASSARMHEVRQFDSVRFVDPVTGLPRLVFMGECASPCFDRQGNLLTYSGGVGIPNQETDLVRSVMAVNPRTFEVVAYTEYRNRQILDPNDFGGAGYFYVDEHDRMVVGTPDGRVEVLGRSLSSLSTTARFYPVRSIPVAAPGGPVTVYPDVLLRTSTTAPKLYALMPDQVGNIWFTIGQGIAGYITPGDEILWLDLNDPARTGGPVLQPDGHYQQIANSQPMDEGDNGGPTGMYVATTHKQYRLQAGPRGPEIVWEIDYDRGPGQKPGQVSWGTGTSPSIFWMGGRKFVTIADNATTMHINVYRAEAVLNPGETRLFAQIAPFGGDTQISDENSLIVAPALDGSYCDIYCENNWGYLTSASVRGTATTRPGFARVRVFPNGSISVGSLNLTLSVPTLVSKMSLPSQIVYTYNKAPDGWYFTGMDAQDLTNLRFSVRVGPGEDYFDNHYAGVSMTPGDPNMFFVGTLLGLTRITLMP